MHHEGLFHESIPRADPMTTAFHIITDCQYGSTGKGLFAGYRSWISQPDVLAMAPSPNAGHTLVLPDGTVKMHRMLPLGILSNKLRIVVLGPGSILDLDALYDEIINLGMPNLRICIHQNAAVVTDEHRAAEANGGTAPGSTRKGVGAAQANRILRRPGNSNIISQVSKDHLVFAHIELIDTLQLQRIYHDAELVQVEGCQGYSLSVYHGAYPYVTCRDVTTASLMSDCGIPMQLERQATIFGTFRTFPIRVANRPESGEWSGPTYVDSQEISFEELGQPQELTTVTKLPRRIFTFSAQQAMEACTQNSVHQGFLNFANYCRTWDELRHIWMLLSQYCKVSYVGFGPSIGDIRSVSDESDLRRGWEQYHD
jgi:adenylosuccinate synthase